MTNPFTPSRLLQAGITIAVLAAAMRVPQIKSAVLNEKKIFGIF